MTLNKLSKIKTKKAQFEFPIIGFVAVIFGVFIVAIVILKIFSVIQGPLGNQLGNQSGGSIAVANMNAVLGPAINLWDKVIVAAFVFSVLFLFISAFFIDSHPFWLVLYIFVAFFLVIFMLALGGRYYHSERCFLSRRYFSTSMTT